MLLLQANTANITAVPQENYSYLQTVFCFGTFNGATVTLKAYLTAQNGLTLPLRRGI
mgnify:CR=1 FL=1